MEGGLFHQLTNLRNGFGLDLGGGSGHADGRDRFSRPREDGRADAAAAELALLVFDGVAAASRLIELLFEPAKRG